MSDRYAHMRTQIQIVLDQIQNSLGSKSFFNHLGSDKYHFKLAIGADGAPCGKDDEAAAWLISCLNVASHIASPNQNFVIAVANCSKTHVCMQRYARKLVNDQHHKQKIQSHGF